MKLVLLHAFPLDERMWEPQRGALEGQEVLAPRLYGLGRSIDEWARRVAEQAFAPSNTVLQGGGAVVVGASMGGYCALRLLAQADVCALVLVGARADADSPERREAREETIRIVRDEGVAWLWEAQRPRLFAPDADEDAVERPEEFNRVLAEFLGGA
jgi:pimeloyl-ACP methyl ester carboxylesterase